jgi:hypothetical protein
VQGHSKAGRTVNHSRAHHWEWTSPLHCSTGSTRPAAGSACSPPPLNTNAQQAALKQITFSMKRLLCMLSQAQACAESIRGSRRLSRGECQQKYCLYSGRHPAGITRMHRAGSPLKGLCFSQAALSGPVHPTVGFQPMTVPDQREKQRASLPDPKSCGKLHALWNSTLREKKKGNAH